MVGVMRALVTGAAGFIGRHTVQLLRQEGHRVFAFDWEPQPTYPEVTSLEGDVSEASAVDAAVDEAKPDVILHLAFLLPPVTEVQPQRALTVNCLGSANVLEAAKRVGTRRVVWTSSMAVYGPRSAYKGAVDEFSAPMPVIFYGATKALVESMSDRYSELGLEVAGLRFNMVYGPGRKQGLGEFKVWGRDIFERAVSGGSLSVPAAEETLDWLYVKDAARAVYRAATVPALPHTTYNILGTRAKVSETIQIIKRVCPSADFSISSTELPDERRFPVFAGNRAAEELAWQPMFDLESGVGDYLDFLRSDREQRDR